MKNNNIKNYTNNKNYEYGCLIFLATLVVLLLFGLIYSAIIMWIWNAVIVVLFGLPFISYWQAFGLYILCNILFKNTTNVRSEDFYDKN